jgi:DNA-directed RNA polymerase specialized sigma24 family protein
MHVATSYFQSNTDFSQHALAHHLAAAAGGDAQAFGRVVDATRNVVCSLALAVVRDVRVSEDIAQEVYLAVWKGLHTLRNPNSFLPWIRQLTRYLSVEHLRWLGRREKKHLPGAHAQDALSQVVDPAAHPETALLQREQALLLAVWFGISRLLNKSVDAHETASLRRFRWVNLALVALACLGFQVGPLVLPLPWSMVVPFAAYALALSLSYRWWLPRILAARLATERLHDHQAIQVHRSNSMKSWAGLIIGLTLGSLGVYFGLKQAGWTP